MKMLFFLATLITIIELSCAKPRRPGDKIYFQDSSELSELEADQRLGTQQRERNHRSRTTLQPRPNTLPQFEQGIPGLYPIKGPPQAPLVLPSTNYSDITNNLVFATQPKAVQQPPKSYHYAGNPYLSRFVSETPNKFSNPSHTSVTSSGNPATTTANPRLTNLLHGSNLLHDEHSTDKPGDTTEITFTERGIFDSAPHCKPNEILVLNKCRPKV